MDLQELKESWELFTFWQTANWYGIDLDAEDSQESRFRRCYDNAERQTVEVFHRERSIGVYEIIMINEDEGVFVRFFPPYNNNLVITTYILRVRPGEEAAEVIFKYHKYCNEKTYNEFFGRSS